MKITTIDQVRQFHDAFGIPNAETPHIPDAPDVAHEGQTMAWCSETLKVMANCLKQNMTAGKGGVLTHRARLMVEELGEVLEAFGRGDAGEILHELCDLDIVHAGTLLQLGLDKVAPRAVEEIHGANMSKLDPETGKPVLDEAGKVVKSSGFWKADVGWLVG